MENTNITVIVIVAILAVALIIFLVVKNSRDKKKLIKPEATDPVEDEIGAQERKKDEV